MRVALEFNFSEGVARTQSGQYQATAESSPGCGRGPGRDVTVQPRFVFPKLFFIEIQTYFSVKKPALVMHINKLVENLLHNTHTHTCSIKADEGQLISAIVLVINMNLSSKSVFNFFNSSSSMM